MSLIADLLYEVDEHPYLFRGGNHMLLEDEDFQSLAKYIRENGSGGAIDSFEMLINGEMPESTHSLHALEMEWNFSRPSKREGATS